MQLSRCGVRGSLGGEVGEGDLMVRDDEDGVLVKGLDGLEAEGGVGGPGAGEAVCLGGEGLMLWSRRVAGGSPAGLSRPVASRVSRSMSITSRWLLTLPAEVRHVSEGRGQW